MNVPFSISTQTAAAGATNLVDALSFAGRILTLEQTQGGDKTVTIPSGGLEYFLGRGVRGNTPSNGYNIGFVNGSSSSNVTFNKDVGTGATLGAQFTVTADTAGTWLIGFTGCNFLTNGYTEILLKNSRTGTIGELMDYHSPAEYQNSNLIVGTEVQSGDVITIRPIRTILGNQGHATTSFWGIKLA